MFTGIIQAIGKITHIAPLDDGVSLRIASSQLDLGDVKTGDSIAVNGVCLTVTAIAEGQFSVDVSRETLNCTVDMDKQGNQVNLEKALRLSDRLGGHLVSGHVDGVGEVITFTPAGESHLLVLRLPMPLLKYIAKKGSITVNGVSLTVNTLTADQVEINLIPHTISATTLNGLQAGAKVNIEVDMLARYVERLIGKQVNLD
ncbi:riboflavin synthase alpha chain [Nitrosospira sp. Nsp14]|uniref:riboflavin synthase n=1 Tax=Nitrosospira sp. Nsp14 TaxID=1855333 RepID=UPI0008E5D400|nr:riboflavin synthase [Nitrosospira sp. Nsp14]SFH39152.1 riboflavin synthase alpha chain [Nitrosospira sp. Nsp14]